MPLILWILYFLVLVTCCNISAIEPCISFEIDAANANTCAASVQAACQCAICFLEAGFPCQNNTWDSHYDDCEELCAHQCNQTLNSSNIDHYNIDDYAWLVPIFAFGIPIVVMIACAIALRISCLHDEKKCLWCNCNWCKAKVTK